MNLLSGSNTWLLPFIQISCFNNKETKRSLNPQGKLVRITAKKQNRITKIVLSNLRNLYSTLKPLVQMWMFRMGKRDKKLGSFDPGTGLRRMHDNQWS